MSHSPHQAQPGYSPAQVLCDGCGECDSRAKSDDHGIVHMDLDTFERAWERASDWQRKGLADLARNEVPAFRALIAIQIQLERRGVPYGHLPRGHNAVTILEAAMPGLLDAYGPASEAQPVMVCVQCEHPRSHHGPSGCHEKMPEGSPHAFCLCARPQHMTAGS